MSSISTSSFHQKINDSCLWINGTWEQITAPYPAPYEMFKYALTWPDLAISTFPICFPVIEKGEGTVRIPCRIFLSNSTVPSIRNCLCPSKTNKVFNKDVLLKKKKKEESLNFMGLALTFILRLLCPIILFLNIFLWYTLRSILLIWLNHKAFYCIEYKSKAHLTPPPKKEKRRLEIMVLKCFWNSRLKLYHSRFCFPNRILHHAANKNLNQQLHVF